MFEFSFGRSLWGGWGVDAVMILNGRAGVIYAVAPLVPSLPASMSHPLDQSCLVALAMPNLVYRLLFCVFPFSTHYYY